MIHLVIKGDIQQAFAAADTHKVELTSIAQREHALGSGEVIASAPDHCLIKAMYWYNDAPLNPPFPAGTLLHYSQS